MFCPKCGTDNPSFAQFCINCGLDLSSIKKYADTGGSSQRQQLPPQTNQTSPQYQQSQQYNPTPPVQPTQQQQPAQRPAQPQQQSQVQPQYQQQRQAPSQYQQPSQQQQVSPQQGYQQERAEPKPKKNYTALYIILCVCGIFIGVLIGFLNDSDGSSPGIDTGIDNSSKMTENVINAAQSVIYKDLKSPSTASFVDTIILDNDDYGRFLVYVAVDAQNAFGAYIRNTFIVIVYNVTDETYSYNTWYGVQEIEGFRPEYYITDPENQHISPWSACATINIMKEFCGWNTPIDE